MEKKKDYKLIQHNLVYHIQGVLSPTKYAAAKNGNIKNGGSQISSFPLLVYSMENKNNTKLSIGLANIYIIIKFCKV